MKNRSKRVPPSGTMRAASGGSPTEDNLSPARRRLLTILGRGAGATAALLPVVWSRPLVETVVLPAHAETSPAGCAVRIVWFNDSSEDEVCLTVEALNGGADPLPPPGDCIVDSEGTFEEVLPPGTYVVSMTANFQGDNFEEDYEGTITCCTGESFPFSGLLEGEAGGSAEEPIAVVTVTEAGDCSIDPPVTKEEP